MFISFFLSIHVHLSVSINTRSFICVYQDVFNYLFLSVHVHLRVCIYTCYFIVSINTCSFMCSYLHMLMCCFCQYMLFICFYLYMFIYLFLSNDVNFFQPMDTFSFICLCLYVFVYLFLSIHRHLIASFSTCTNPPCNISEYYTPVTLVFLSDCSLYNCKLPTE